MKIFFIVDETTFFLPEWLDEVLAELKKSHKIVGITPLITKNSPTFYSHLLKNIYRIGIWGLLKLFYQLLRTMSKYPHSIKEVAKQHNLRIFSCSKVNDPDYLNTIKKLSPDVIVSSCSQIFKKRLLQIPRIACINRHSSLLPSYGGVFPLLWTMLKKERKTGVTIHYMTSEIDEGKIIFQKEIDILPKETLFNLYKRVYKISARALIKAIDIIKYKQKPKVIGGIKPSYYSFPKESDWSDFFRKKYKII